MRVEERKTWKNSFLFAEMLKYEGDKKNRKGKERSEKWETQAVRIRFLLQLHNHKNQQ